MICWGLWGFIPKVTTRYISPTSAIIYEVIGGLLIAAIALFWLDFRVETHPLGMALGLANGFLGFLGAFLFLQAVTRGPVTLIVTVSALYPVVSVVLAVLLIQEAITLQQAIGVVLAIAAMVLIAA